MKSKIVGAVKVIYKGKDGNEHRGVRVYIEEPIDPAYGVGVKTKDLYFANKDLKDFPLKDFTCVQYEVGFNGKAYAVGIIW